MEATLSFTVPPFTLENYLGKGGRGIVFRTDETTATKLVPLQKMPPSYAALHNQPLTVEDNEEEILIDGKVPLDLSAQADYNFALREYLALHRLQGREHLLQVQRHSYAALEGILYSVLEMDYLQGSPLSHFQEEAFGLLDIGKIVVDMVDALKGLNEEDLIHGDMKPDNIIYQAGSMAQEGSAVLIDFDTVIFYREDVRNLLLGTYNYFSPDHIRGNFTPALDLFSLGLVARTLALGGGELLTTHYRHLPQSSWVKAHLKYLYGYSNFNRDILVLELKQVGTPDAFAEAIGLCLDAVPSQRNPQPLREEAQRLAQGAYPCTVYQEHYELLSL